MKLLGIVKAKNKHGHVVFEERVEIPDIIEELSRAPDAEPNALMHYAEILWAELLWRLRCKGARDPVYYPSSDAEINSKLPPAKPRISYNVPSPRDGKNPETR